MNFIPCGAILLYFSIASIEAVSLLRFQESRYIPPVDLPSLEKVLLSGEIFEDKCLLDAEAYIRALRGSEERSQERAVVQQFLHMYYDILNMKCQSTLKGITVLSNVPDTLLWLVKWISYADALCNAGFNTRCVRACLIGKLSDIGYNYTVDCRKKALIQRLLRIVTENL